MSAHPSPLHPLIRTLAPGDLDAVMRIEEASYPFPWTRGIFADCLRVGYACNGLQVGSELVGYSIFNWAAGECHLLNICVDPDWRRHGFGSILLEHAIAQAESARCRIMFLEVRPSNPGAARMYRHRGFREIGRRAGYYRAAAGREDAIVMQLELLAAG